MFNVQAMHWSTFYTVLFASINFSIHENEILIGNISFNGINCH